MTYHTIIIVGNLGNDPDMKYTPSGEAVTSFSVAANEQWTGNDGQKMKRTIWFRCTAWGKNAENVHQYLAKGSKVLVEGRLKPDDKTGGPRIWERNDGASAASYEVTASTVRFLSSKGETEESSETSPGGNASGGDQDEIDF